MELRKIIIALMALLLAGAVMVPMVSAGVDHQDQNTVDNFEKSYHPDEYTFTFTGKEITQEKIDKKSEELIQSFESQYEKILPEGYRGSVSVELSGDEKIAAYGFRILPNGETVTYADIVSSNENETGLEQAGDRLHEWMATTLKEKTEVAQKQSGSLSQKSAKSLPAIITSSSTNRDYSGIGRVTLSTTWYWDNLETDSAHDYFFTQSYLQSNPGIAISGYQPYRNFNPKIEIDPGYSYTYPPLPGVYVQDATPGTTTGHSTIGLSLSSSSASLGWSTVIPDSSVTLTNPSGYRYRWTEMFSYYGSDATSLFIFKPGVLSISSQSSSRNGNTYVVSRVMADCEDGFVNIIDGIPHKAPTGTNYWGHLLKVRYSGGYTSA